MELRLQAGRYIIVSRFKRLVMQSREIYIFIRRVGRFLQKLYILRYKRMLTAFMLKIS